MEASPSCLTATQMCRLESVSITEFIWMLVLRIRFKNCNSCDSFYFSVSFTLPWQNSFSNQPDLVFFFSDSFHESFFFFFSAQIHLHFHFLSFYALIPSDIFYLFFFFFFLIRKKEGWQGKTGDTNSNLQNLKNTFAQVRNGRVGIVDHWG